MCIIVSSLLLSICHHSLLNQRLPLALLSEGHMIGSCFISDLITGLHHTVRAPDVIG